MRNIHSSNPLIGRKPRLRPRDWLALFLVASFMLVAVFATSPLLLSLSNQILIAATAALSVFIMLRMDLMSFAVPFFMALGGYAVALLGLRLGVTDVLLLTIAAFAVPAFVALPIGAMVLRLKGVYFVLVTFVLSEILQLVLFETAPLSGGSNGLVGMPAVTLFGFELWENHHVLMVTCGLATLGFAITAFFTRALHHEFSAIETNEVLAESLGLACWKYKALGFAVSAGVAGLAGFALVNMLMTAHPTSFAPLSSANYITYAIVGGKDAVLGALIGALVLVTAHDIFAFRGELSPALFGLLIIIVTLTARHGLLGLIDRGLGRLRRDGRDAKVRVADKEKGVS